MKSENGVMLFGVGMLIGAIGAAMFTPRNGTEMRDAIRRRANNLREDMADTADEAKRIASTAVDDTKQLASKTKDTIKADTRVASVKP